MPQTAQAGLGGEGGQSGTKVDGGAAGLNGAAGSTGGAYAGEGGATAGGGGALGESGAPGMGVAGAGGARSDPRPDGCLVDVECVDREICRAYWKADEGSGTVLIDSSPLLYHGTISAGATWAPGWHGLGLALPTGNEFAEVPHRGMLRVFPAISLSVWLKPAELDRLQFLVKKAGTDLVRDGVPYEGYELALETDGRPFFRVNQVTSLDTYRIDATLPVVLGEWTHLAATYDLSIAKLYIDGVEIASRRFDVPLGGSPVRLGIGAECDANSACSADLLTRFNGVLDEIRVFGTALSASDVAKLARRGPVISWNFDEDPALTEGRIRDGSGACNDGELVDGADVVGAGCMLGHAGCVALDGNTVSVAMGPDSRLESSFTAAVWVQRGTAGMTNVVSQWDEQGGFSLGIDPDGHAYASVGGTADSPMFAVTAPTSQPDGVWRHLVATFDGASLRLYEDGLLRAERAALGAKLTANAHLLLGSSADGASPLTARLDELRVYRRALTNNEIAAIATP